MNRVPVIVDTEGVTVNTFDEHLVPIYNAVRNRKGLPSLTAEDYRIRVRGWWIDTLKELGIDDEDSAALYATLRTSWLKEGKGISLYGGAEGLLTFLNPHPLYVPVLKSASRHLPLIIDRFNLDRYFSTIVQVNPRSRDFMNSSFDELAKSGQPNPSVGIVIDDQSENLENAKLYGKDRGIRILTVGVSYGFYSPERVVAVHPDRVAHTPEEVVTILREFEDALKIQV